MLVAGKGVVLVAGAEPVMTAGEEATEELGEDTEYTVAGLYSSLSAGVKLCQSSLSLALIPSMFNSGNILFLVSRKARQKMWKLLSLGPCSETESVVCFLFLPFVFVKEVL